MPWWAILLISLGGLAVGLLVGAVVAIGWFGSQMFKNW